MQNHIIHGKGVQIAAANRENTNGLIRQYFPKGSSFENVTHQQVADVQNKLNNRPRKKLGYFSPNEFYKINFSNTNTPLRVF